MPDITFPAPGDLIAGRYRVEEVIGAGGAGVVVRAVHLDLDQHVAIKILRNASPTSVERFRREARVVAQLQSEHVARVTDFGQLPDGSPFIVMDFLVGRDLGEELAVRGPLPVAEAVGHILSACEALAEAHASGIVHRDIKPKNMFLARGVGNLPVVKMLDFGLAKVDAFEGASVTRTEDIFGSPAYMAPEQMRSARDVDARADIWALGVTLYELLTAQSPFDATSVPETCARVLREPAPPIRETRPDVSAVLARVIERCLEKDRDARFQSVFSLVQKLEPFGPSHQEGISKRIEAIRSVPRSERGQALDRPQTPRTAHAPASARSSLPLRSPLPTLAESQDLNVALNGPRSTVAVARAALRSRGLPLMVGAILVTGAVGLFFTYRPASTPPSPAAASHASVPSVPAAPELPIAPATPASTGRVATIPAGPTAPSLPVADAAAASSSAVDAAAPGDGASVPRVIHAPAVTPTKRRK